MPRFLMQHQFLFFVEEGLNARAFISLTAAEMHSACQLCGLYMRHGAQQ